MRGASHKAGRISSETGTAVITMNDCSALTPPAPIVINTTAASPMPTHQKARSHFLGVSLPDMAMATVAMASPLVATEMKLRKMNSADTSPAQGRFCVMPSSIASGSLPWAVTLPGFCNSSPMPAPPPP